MYFFLSRCGMPQGGNVVIFLNNNMYIWLVKNIYIHYIECEIECDLVWATNDFFNQPDYILLFKKMMTLPPCGIPHLDRKKYIKT